MRRVIVCFAFTPISGSPEYWTKVCLKTRNTGMPTANSSLTANHIEYCVFVACALFILKLFLSTFGDI